MALEVNFDGLVGPSHNYAGLARGNLASQKHRAVVSQPRAAALQGLEKMKLLMDLGVPQAVLPPPLRPDLHTLRRLGFAGSDAEVVQQAYREAPRVLFACYSASSMWTANAANVSPSADTADGRVHLTPANLSSQFHRSIESADTAALLRAVFPDERHFAHHAPLPAGVHFCDEGAANHMRLCVAHGQPGLEIFVYGRRAFEPDEAPPPRFPARQTLEASAAVARLHGLDPRRTLFVQQNPAAIDAGVFHNDVIAVSNLHVLLYHERAFADPEAALRQIESGFIELAGMKPILIRITEAEVPLADAVRSYLFNSQVVSLPDGSMTLIVPGDCGEVDSARRWLEELPQRDAPIRSVHRVNIRQSMQNGGGPACLRLRIVLDERQFAAVHPGVRLTPALYDRLVDWVRRHHRESLSLHDLSDPRLIDECRVAHEAVMGLLGLG